MQYVVAVRALCEFTAKRGDLDLRFTPSPSAQEGMAGHIVVTSRRGPGYRTEISLSGEFKHLLVRGRADGYDPDKNRLEEIKTFRGDLTRMPDNHRQLHWAQVKIYGHLLCLEMDLPEVDLALVYYDVASQRETVISQHHCAAALAQYFEEQCERFLAWSEQELAHRAARNAALLALRFVHPEFRPGQRPLAEAVFKTAAQGRCLLAQAPTGIGKTIGTLFPLLKALPGQGLDKIFFLAAKTPGRRLALDALERMRDSADALPLRTLELVARDKSCEHPDKACHGESCPLAQGFYDRLPDARSAALALRALDQQAVRAVALAHGVCPYYLTQDLARWSDVVVGDYNYYFDANAMLYGLATLNQWRVGVLVDEAHNLIERARAMYSADLDRAGFDILRRSAPPALKKPLDRIRRQWQALDNAQVESYRAYAEVPEAFLFAMQQAVTAITDYFIENPVHVDANLQRFYFDALHFSRMAELFGTHSLFDLSKKADFGEPGASRLIRRAPPARPGSVLCIRNVVPAPFLARRFADAHAVTLFSATLNPRRYYHDTLGLPGNAAWVDVESPFMAEQLTVRLVSRISTRFQHRAESIDPIVDLIARQYAQRPGNYLVFVSSYDYLQQLAARFAAREPHTPRWEQSRHMDEAERERFLSRFTPHGRGIGFAVLGGAFAEGIDLPGDRLIGAFIATLGLPQLNPINEEVRRRMNATFGDGYAYTYLYPGIRKVVQAAGRVIRTRMDRGVVYLIDDRFARPEVRALLPAWWAVWPEQRDVDQARAIN